MGLRAKIWLSLRSIGASFDLSGRSTRHLAEERYRQAMGTYYTGTAKVSDAEAITRDFEAVLGPRRTWKRSPGA